MVVFRPIHSLRSASTHFEVSGSRAGGRSVCIRRGGVFVGPLGSRDLRDGDRHLALPTIALTNRLLLTLATIGLLAIVSCPLTRCIGRAPWHTYGRCHGGSRFGCFKTARSISHTRYTICASLTDEFTNELINERTNQPTN